ncbi:dehydrogenase [Dehalogenimonas alkenigignens]|uniref:Dehydrogenase n=1 Tax=Dehalogenimonas alkenigignens TaxID=1217799 RepID=A0A0W0GGW6_9CHLR|nr:SDR family oxidoreductase [Dehalogenimonas alkenigignens]KTB47816.1 dehydrogenase [Dehalogenimonas alkenigignens]
MARLIGKVALITGAGSGIGRATAQLFAKEGARVMVADISGTGGQETVDMIRTSGGEAAFVKVDVSKAVDVEKAVKSVVDKYGRLDILYNNAGIEGALAPTHDSTEENWDRVIDINLKGVYLGMKYGITQMLKQGGGIIVSTASVAGLVGFTNMPAYCASKGGVVQLTKTAALEYAKQNIRVNCVCPGVIATPMIDRFTGGSAEARQSFVALEPCGRLGNPEEIAQAVLFLASDEACFITGVAFPVDGGFIAQ